MSAPKAVPVLYLDIDGTVRHGKDELGRFVNGPDDVVVFPEAVEMMSRWKAGGHRQPSWCTDWVDSFVHHPSAIHPEMARCWCRKPSPGLLIEAALDLASHYGEMYPPYMALMVGDRPEDQECARIASIDFQWAADWRAQA